MTPPLQDLNELRISVGKFDTDGGIHLGIDGEAFDRVHITPQGEVKTGNGTVAPTALSGGAAPDQARASSPPILGYYTSSGAWTWFASGNMGYLANTPAVQNDEVTWEMSLKAGTYTMRLGHRIGSAQGAATFYFDGVLATTTDFYNAATGASMTVVTGLTIVGDGLHNIRLVMATKNASSTGYGLSLATLALIRTGA